MELVQDELLERDTRPRSDPEGAGVEDARRPANAVGLPARAGVGPGVAAVEHEAIVVAWASGNRGGPESVFLLGERVVTRGEAHRDRARAWRPDAQLGEPGLDRDGTEQ